MKTMIKSLQHLYFIICITALFTAFTTPGYAQGTGNHLTIYMDNCYDVAPNVIQFDMFVVSDGAANSNLLASSFQFGVDFNTGILQSGATITPSYINNSNDTVLANGGWCFPSAKYPNHIRAIQGIRPNPLSVYKMTFGQPYRIGTFKLTSSANYVANSSPNFSLQTSVAVGKTVTEALVWIGTGCCTKSFYVTGTTDSTRSVYTNCSLVLSTSNEFHTGNAIHIYPNPLPKGNSAFYISCDDAVNNGTIYLYDVLGNRLYRETFSGRQKEVSCEVSPGVYFVRVNDGRRDYTQKIIVQ